MINFDPVDVSWTDSSGRTLTALAITINIEAETAAIRVEGWGSRAKWVPFNELEFLGENNLLASMIQGHEGDDDETIDLSFLDQATQEQIDEATVIVNSKFNTLEAMIRGVAVNKLNGLVVRGDGGIGKTHTIIKVLSANIDDGDETPHEIDGEQVVEARQFRRISGHMTPLQLFNNLYKYNDPNIVIVFDDCDGVFKDQSCLNVLKAAMDTNDPRIVNWNSSTQLILTDRFIFQGNIIILTNDNLASRDPHTKAFLDRVHSLDLGLTPLQRVVRLQSVAEAIRIEKGLEEDVTTECLDWLLKNINQLGNKMSIRTFLKLLALAEFDPENWKDLAEGSMFSLY